MKYISLAPFGLDLADNFWGQNFTGVMKNERSNVSFKVTIFVIFFLHLVITELHVSSTRHVECTCIRNFFHISWPSNVRPLIKGL